MADFGPMFIAKLQELLGERGADNPRRAVRLSEFSGDDAAFATFPLGGRASLLNGGTNDPAIGFKSHPGTGFYLDDDKVVWVVDGVEVFRFSADTLSGPVIDSLAKRATVGGTANAITLTSPFSLSTGLKLRFRANSANTAAPTISLNGGPAKACVTITGAAVPADYIRTGADTEIYYGGTNWVVNREIERGTGTNGDWERYAHGAQRCTSPQLASTGVTTAEGALFKSAPITWTFEKPFSSVPVLQLGQCNDSRCWQVGSTPTVSDVDIRIYSTVSIVTAVQARLSAKGWWY